VIDWEGGRIGPPLCDLLYLATHWAITAQTSSARGQPDELRTFSHVFLEPTRAWVTKDAVWAVVARYLAALELDARFLPMFLVLTWVQLALGRHRRAVALQNLQPDPRADNPPLHYLECLSHHMDELLATSATETLGRT
jgi:aminoglycoside phosphotransferase (APT) family kinase protein